MVKLVDTSDLGSDAERRVGSIPTIRTRFQALEGSWLGSSHLLKSGTRAYSVM